MQTAPQTLTRRRLSREESRRETRLALIESAEREMLETGIFTASLRRICAGAGYTLGAFYSNFADRDDLLLAVVDRRVDSLLARLDELARPAGADAPKAAEAAAVWLVELRDRALFDLFLECALYAGRREGFRRRYAECKRQWHARLAEALDALIRRSGARPVMPTEQLTQGLSALWHGLALEAMVTGNDRTEALITLFLEALLRRED